MDQQNMGPKSYLGKKNFDEYTEEEAREFLFDFNLAMQEVLNDEWTEDKISGLNDLELVQEMFEGLHDRIWAHPDRQLQPDVRKWNPYHQVVYFAWGMAADLSNGGFPLFYDSTGAYADLIPERFRLAGMNELADVIESTTATWQKWKNNNDETAITLLNEYERSYYQQYPIEELVKPVALFIRNNPSHFTGVNAI